MIKYILFFMAVFVVFVLIAMYALIHPFGVSAGVIGWWRDYDDESIGQITVFKTSISYYRQQKLFRLNGHWANRAFYSLASSDATTEVVVARELPNEDLEMNLSYFDSDDHRKITCVKIMRTSEEYHPYPVRDLVLQVSYPPPKGMIKEGMLEADLHTLPWQAYTNEEPQYVFEETIKSNSYHGSHLVNGWPHVFIYKSDDPKLPELRVTVEKGRVTQVVGGSEDAQGPSYMPPPDTTAQDQSTGDDENSRSSWVEWLFDLIFKK